MKEKAYELRQQRATLIDEAQTILQRAEKDSGGVMTSDQRARYEHILGNGKPHGSEGCVVGQAFELAQRISQLDRLVAVQGNGQEQRGTDPFGGRLSNPLPHEDPNAVKGRRYSILRAAKCLYERRPVDGLEGEVSQELAHRSGKAPQGFLMPYSSRGVARLEAEKRALDTTAGVGSIPTILDKDWIELLRNKMVVKQAGMREITDLVGQFAIPRQSAAATAYWVAQSGSPTGSNQTLDQVLFMPHTIGAFTDISRRFFELTILDSGEEFVKEDLTAIIARGVDLAALNGLGQNNQPLGLMQNSAITEGNTVSLGPNGAAPAWANLVEMNTIVGRGNALDLGEATYLGNADVEGTLATTAKIGSTFPVFLLEGGKVYNKRFLSTQQLPNNLAKGSGTNLSPIVYGVFNQLVAGYWSGIDILVDPYTGSSSGTIRVVALQDMDIQARHNQAFSFILDMVSNQTQ